jgi:hypothetical protein
MVLTLVEHVIPVILVRVPRAVPQFVLKHVKMEEIALHLILALVCLDSVEINVKFLDQLEALEVYHRAAQLEATIM